MEIVHTCCFTGHRPEKLHIPEVEVKKRLEQAIKSAINDGYTNFITGMARGVDIWAGEIVLKEKKANDKIKLICAIPFENFGNSRFLAEKTTYDDMINMADSTFYICKHYFKGAFQLRNRYMVDNSSRIICAYAGEKGGTRNTLLYAKKFPVQIINILNESFSDL